MAKTPSNGSAKQFYESVILNLPEARKGRQQHYKEKKDHKVDEITEYKVIYTRTAHLTE